MFYRTINSLHDHQVLQEDLLNLTKWASDWKIDFNVTKCHVLCITKKREPSNFIYTANSDALTWVPEWDYLGVTCTETFRWGAHCFKIAAKVNTSPGVIRGSLKPCSVEVKERAYMTLVRPTVEYFSSSWNHYTDTDIKRLEQIQKNAALSLYATTITLQQVLLAMLSP